MDDATQKMLIAVIGTTISLCWGVWTWHVTQRDKRRSEHRDAERLAETRRIEATRPFLEKQLVLYGEAALICGRIASSPTESNAIARFWELYWGELALFENEGVAASMVRFGRHYNTCQKTNQN